MGDFFQERESKVLEFKSTVKRFEGIIKTAVAFANGVGGKIIADGVKPPPLGVGI